MEEGIAAANEGVDKLNTEIGKIYNTSQYNVTGTGDWAVGSNKLTVPIGSYVVIRKATNTSGNGMLCGKGYNTGQYVSSIGSDSALYVGIEHYDAQADIPIFYYLKNGDIAHLFIEAIRIGA